MEKNEMIFVDSNFFVALFNPGDSLYQKAIKIAKELDEKKISLVISNFIFLEVVTVLSQNRGKKVALEVGKYLLSNPLVKIVHVDEEIQEQTWKIFQEIKEKNISFVDCSIISVMKAENISKLLTFDIHFKKLQKRYRFSLHKNCGVV